MLFNIFSFNFYNLIFLNARSYSIYNFYSRQTNALAYYFGGCCCYVILPSLELTHRQSLIKRSLFLRAILTILL